MLSIFRAKPVEQTSDMHSIVFGFITWKSVLLGSLLFLITFSISLAIVSVIMVKIPPDYFKKDRPRKLWADKHKAVRYLGIFGKNLLGVVLVVLGILMSLPGVPGQGILTILLGVMLLDFPGKQKLEHRIVSRPKVLGTINKLRHKFGKPKLVLD
jgi:hypothetical protein